jgi:hypothetical protein
VVQPRAFFQDSREGVRCTHRVSESRGGTLMLLEQGQDALATTGEIRNAQSEMANLKSQISDHSHSMVAGGLLEMS